MAMMFDDFMSTGMQTLDYDRVVRCAVTIQTDPDVCKVLNNTTPCKLEEVWIPEDAVRRRPSPPQGSTSQADTHQFSARISCSAVDHGHVLRLHIHRGCAHCSLVSGA